ncbi:fibronectin type III domain-containing protein, partial [bacterium]|nr:fibronectin type III domain-containing protein [bacterium]
MEEDLQSLNNENYTIFTYTILGNQNLMNDTAYIFTVTANNINGSSISSEPSNPIIPVTIPDTITGNSNLINGEPYTFNVTANYINGTSARSEDSNSVITSIIPDPPTTITGISENSQVIVSWIAPISNGGSIITSYTVISNPVDELVTIPPNITTDGTTTTTTITGLVNGKAYTFNVFATNINGDSLLSITSSEIIPSTVPNKPTAVYAVTGNKEATIYWEPPLFNGGSAIINYTVTSSSDDSNPNGITKTVGDMSSTITKGLKNGIPYTFTVKATNIKGSSIKSEPSLPITPITLLDAPNTITCTAGNKFIDLSWNIPNNGDLEILYYRIQYSSNNNPTWINISSNTNHISITGLINGTRYIFRIATIYLLGPSDYSLNTSEHIPFSIVESPYITNSKIGNNSASV